VNAGGGTRNWTADEARDLWMSSRVQGYTGHHINSVEAFPEWVTIQVSTMALAGARTVYKHRVSGVRAHGRVPWTVPFRG
jgi:hypothetical protein